MTAELEYSYLNAGFDLRATSGIMNRAVRVKEAVKDKLGRVFNNNVKTSEVSLPVEQVQPVVNKLEDLIDLTDENLNVLNDKINALQVQGKVNHTIRRAVLFTSSLVSKIDGVSNKWFKRMPEVVNNTEPAVELPKVEITNFLGGEVVPGTWDDAVTKEEVNELSSTPVESTPAVGTEAVVSEPTLEQVPVVPTMEVTPEEPQVSAAEPVIPTMESENILPNFFDPINSSESELSSTEEPTDEFVPEPTQVGEETEHEIEPESVEQEESVAEPEVEKPTEVETESSLPVEGEKKQPLSIEDRITELLNRKREVYNEEEPAVKSVTESSVDEDMDREMSKKPELSQSAVMAKLQRVNNVMKEKDSEIRTLKDKNESLVKENKEIRDKVNSYDTVVNDLTAKNTLLSNENDRLSSKADKLESTYKGRIEELESQVEELTKSKKEETESSKTAINDLKEQHSKEIEELKRVHAEELRKVNEANERKVQSIYATISEVLGESYSQEETEEYKKVA